LDSNIITKSIRKLHYIYAENNKLVGIYVYHENSCDSVFAMGPANKPVIIAELGIHDTMYYIHQERLGSYDVITNDTGNIPIIGTKQERLAYDIWGNRTKYDDWTQREYFDYGDIKHIFRRGFTQHEHLGSFGIINMNGRLFDPNTASFFSPDPFVVDATNTQAFNRYSYCLNNPLMYTDPTGEFIFLVLNLFKDLVTNIGNSVGNIINGRTDKWNWQGTTNSWKILGGWFQGDWKQILSRMTWELPQTILGYGYLQIRNFGENVDRVDYFDGATFATKENSSGGSVSLGSFININNSGKVEGSFKDYILTNPLYMHEYGHYIQSREQGWGYLFTIGIPSLISAATSKKIENDPYDRWTHDFFGVEMEANMRASFYFGKHYGVDWHRQRYRKGVIENYYPIWGK
jgi:RHS repeat-associated protein